MYYEVKDNDFFPSQRLLKMQAKKQLLQAHLNMADAERIGFVLRGVAEALPAGAVLDVYVTTTTEHDDNGGTFPCQSVEVERSDDVAEEVSLHEIEDKLGDCIAADLFSLLNVDDIQFKVTREMLEITSEDSVGLAIYRSQFRASEAALKKSLAQANEALSPAECSEILFA